MEPAISIIMPLYNAERFLEETLNSVSKQTFQDYELLCINDGSDDNTMKIVQRFQKDDSRIKLLYNEKRSGAAVARNIGIREAKGKYLIFLDGDDIFDEALLALTYQRAEDMEAEIVIFEAVHALSDCICDTQFVEHSTNFLSKFEKKGLSVQDIKVCDFLMWPGNLGTKLFQRKFICREHLEFQNLSCENDTYFVIMAYFLAKRITRLDSGRVMLYARDHDTPSRISSVRDPMCIYYAMLKVRNELEKKGMFNLFSQMFYYRAFFFLFDGLRAAKTREKRTEFYNFLINKGFEVLFDGNGYDHGIDDYIRNKKQQFIDLRMEDGWEDLICLYDVYLKDNLQEIKGIFEMPDGKRRRVGVWGTGENGRRFLKFCKKNAFPVQAVIDRDGLKQGTYCEGYCIQPPQAVKGVDTVIATPTLGYSAVKEQAQNYREDIEVIDLNAYICLF